MPVAPSVPTSSADEETPQRSGRLLLVLGVLVLVSAVVAGVVIFSSGGSTTPPKDPVAPVRAADHFLSVGRPSAPTKVVVYEDFASPESRSFEIASRDFLRAEAAQAGVYVEYHPVVLHADDRSSAAVAAWGAVVDHGRPGQSLALHDLLFDQQPATQEAVLDSARLTALAKQAGVKQSSVLDAVGVPGGAWPAATSRAAAAAGVRTTPVVRVDGHAVSATTPVALADQVQRLVLKGADAGAGTG